MRRQALFVVTEDKRRKVQEEELELGPILHPTDTEATAEIDRLLQIARDKVAAASNGNEEWTVILNRITRKLETERDLATRQLEAASRQSDATEIERTQRTILYKDNAIVRELQELVGYMRITNTAERRMHDEATRTWLNALYASLYGKRHRVDNKEAD